MLNEIVGHPLSRSFAEDGRKAPEALMRRGADVSLVVFTLCIQSAVGLVWVGCTARWIEAQGRNGLFRVQMAVALGLTVLGLAAALGHLAKPRLAVLALRNLKQSWLSREVVLAPLSAAALIWLIWRTPAGGGGVVGLEIGVCLLGLVLLGAMRGVYHIRAVPVWHSATTGLAFLASALMLGGALGIAAAVLGGAFFSISGSALTASVVAIVFGLLAKTMVVILLLKIDASVPEHIWYAKTAGPLKSDRIFLFSMGLIVAGIICLALTLTGPTALPLWSFAAFFCFAAAEILGRHRFYKSYQRIGL